MRETVPDCRASAPRFEDGQNPGADRGLEWKESPVAGCQRRGLSITDSLTGAGRLDYIKAFLGKALRQRAWDATRTFHGSPQHIREHFVLYIEGCACGTIYSWPSTAHSPCVPSGYIFSYLWLSRRLKPVELCDRHCLSHFGKIFTSI
jgi:hypothetical protein